MDLIFTTFDTATGLPLSCIRASSAAQVALNTPEGAVAVEGDHLEAGLFWKDGALHPLPSGEGPGFRWDLEAGAWIDDRTPEELEAIFQLARQDAHRQVLALCTQFEDMFVTPLPAQPLKYARKEAEARAYLADPSPDPAAYPWIMAEVGITAPTAYEVAQVYLNLSDIWTQVATRYEPIRLTAMNALEGVTTPEQLQAVMTTFALAMGQLAAMAQGATP